MTGNYKLSRKAIIAAAQYGKEEEYWLKKFSGELTKTYFPYDYIELAPIPGSTENKTLEFKFTHRCVSQLMKISKELDHRLYIILTATLTALLYKYTGNRDIIIGSPILKQETESDLINTFLPLRNLVHGRMTFKKLLLDYVKPTIEEAGENQDYPFEALLSQLKIPFKRGEFPLFRVGILLENIQDKKYFQSLDLDMIFSFLHINGGIEGKIDYNPALYKPDTIDRLIHHFERLLEQVLDNVNILIPGIDILGEEEKKQIIFDFNKGNRQARYPHQKNLHQLFAEQVERTPDHVALLGPKLQNKKYKLQTNSKLQITNNKQSGAFRADFDAFGEIQLSYYLLNEKSDRLAHLLIEKGVKPDTIVGIMVDRSIEMIIGILGILKAGGAYLPIDPDYPEERIEYVLTDSRVEILLTIPKLQVKIKAEVDKNFNQPPASPMQFINMEILHEPGIVPSHSTLASTSTCQVSPTNLAYIIYTSGTTGKPKGSLIEHRNVIGLMAPENHLFDFGSHDIWTMFHSYCFDFSVWEMYGALLYSGRLVLITRMAARDPRQYLQILKAEQVTILNQTPAAFYQLAQQELDSPGKNLSLKYVIFGGEALTPSKLENWKEKYPETKLINMFGITETTVHVTYREILHNDIKLNISNIGGPLPTLNVYITNRHRKLLPIGVPGELTISGAGVCRGYLNQPELTAEKFNHDLWDQNNKKLLRGVQGGGFLEKSPPGRRRQITYRSGDLGRWLPDGNIEYLGRIDNQVKIRGYRVELGEIEAQLMRHFAVKEAIALEWQDPDGHKALNAYVVPDPKYAFPVKQLTKLERDGRMENQPHHEYPNRMTIFYINRHETDFMYREIFEEQSYIRHGITLEEGACIFDVGANIGMFSLYVQYTCKNPKIYAFEPIPPIFEVLSLNTSIYNRNVEVFLFGLSQKESEAVFTYYPHATVLSSRFANQSQEIETVKAFIKNEPGEKPGEEQLSEDQVSQLLEDRLKSTSFSCKLKSLSQIIREKAIEKIDLLKIDVEKAEIDVLKGIDEADWPKIRQLVIEVHDVDNGLEKVTRQLRQRGYRVAVQQDSELKDTGLYNVYAVSNARSATGTPGSSPEKQQVLEDHDYYISPGRFIDDLRTFLEQKIPGYMVPSYFVPLDHIPLNPNGKVDRKALPDPGIKTGKKYVPPGNPVQVKLAEIWARVLGIEKDVIGIDSDFFQLGGHSLKATILISNLHKALDVKIPLAVLFKIPTIRQLAQYIGGLKTNRFVGLEGVEKKDYYPLSSAQKRLYVLQQMELQGTAYNVVQSLVVQGDLDKKALENTFRQLLQRHESLRTFFRIVNGEPVQRIHEKNFKFQVKNYKQIPDSRKSITKISESFIQPFDLSRAPLLRVGLIKEAEQKHILMIDMHHIVTDGTSMDLLVKESMALYAGEALQPLKYQYKDYSQWQNSEPGKEAIKKQEQYWMKQFREEVPVLNLPLDFPRPAVQSFAGDYLLFELSAEDTASLKRLVMETGVTLYMLLLAIFNILLSKLGGQADIIVGTPIASRRHADLENIMGMFVNTLALRNFPDPDKKFSNFLLQLKKRTLQAFENQEFQFEDLVEKVYVHRDPSRNPIFDTMFSVQNMETPTNDIPFVDISHLRIRPYENRVRISIFDLSLTCFEGEDKLVFLLSYCTRLFKKETGQRFIKYFKQGVSAVLAGRNKKIARLEIISREDKKQVLYDFNDTVTAYPKEKNLPQLFEEQAMQAPERKAITIIRDLSPLYEELESTKINPRFIHDLEECCFKKNPYLFRFPGQTIINALDIFDSHEKDTLIMLRTQKLNYVAVNEPVLLLLEYFNGRTNVKSLFNGIGKTKHEFVIYNIRKDEYSDFSPGIKHRIRVNGQIEDMICLIKSLHNCHLIELTDVTTGLIPVSLNLQPEVEPGKEINEKLLRGVPDAARGSFLEKSPPEGQRQSEFSVLLLGDRTGQGCSRQCFYCGGCRDAQQRIFKRDKPFLRGIEEVRRDIKETMKYTSTFWFDFDLPLATCFEYYKKLWEGIPLSSHFCEFYYWKLPTSEFIDCVAKTFKYVYINIDLCSLSEKHRLKLSSQGVVKPQPTDEELFSIFEHCETHPNVEIIINHITGLPYFTAEDIQVSRDVLTHLTKTYTTLGGMNWGRLHAQPGAPLTRTYKKYHMYCCAETFEGFIQHSECNLKEDQYPQFETYHYPYICYQDDHLNSLVTRFYLEADKTVKNHVEARRKLHMVNSNVTYNQLNEKSNQLAWRLKTSGVRPGNLVGILMNRSIEMVIGMLAILKAGCAYLPIDPKYPLERIDYMLKDSHTSVLLTETNLLNGFAGPGFGRDIDIIDMTAENSYLKKNIKLESNRTPGALAYVMYTSGSTGRPKGVMIPDKSVIRLVKVTNYIDFPREGRLLMTGAVAFDIATFEIWGSLLNQLRLYILVVSMIGPQRPGNTLNPISTIDPVTDTEKLNLAITVNQISILHLVPQLFNQVAAENLELFAPLQFFLVGGDLVKPRYINQLRKKYPRLKILHMYGPTENTTFSTYLSIARDYENTIPIGKPVSNSSVYILGKGNELLPIGAVGELCVGGHGLSAGYLNNPEMTTERFIFFYYRSYKSYIPKKIYRTGDMARWLSDGNIEFLGRIDHQVKIRGIRIELGEIESQLLDLPGIKEVVVLPGETRGGDKYLCAYIVPFKKMTNRELRRYLSKRLPGYMIPSYFVILEQLPLNPNGKLDRGALPVPGIRDTTVYVGPGNEIEKKLVRIWSDILEIKKEFIGIDTNFFELGGHSLKAARVISRVNKEFNVNIPLVELFKKPYIRQMAVYIREVGDNNVVLSAPSTILVLLKQNPAEQGHLFFLHDGSGEVEVCIELCNQLQSPMNCWGIRANPLQNYTPVKVSLPDMAAYYIKEIKSLQPQGPYFLIGWSLGGMIAFEMALQLEERGEELSLLALIDAPAPQDEQEVELNVFTLESELEWVMEYLPGNKIKNRVRNVSHINEIWPFIVKQLEENDFSIEMIKRLIPYQLTQIIPNYHQLGTRDLIYFLNTNRTLTHTKNLYLPSKKIHSTLHYLKASQSPGFYLDCWKNYCAGSIKSYEIIGDHFTILKKPGLPQTAKILDHILSEMNIIK